MKMFIRRLIIIGLREIEVFKERQEKYNFPVKDIFEEVDAEFEKFKKDAQKEVSYLVKEFECKKAASCICSCHY